MGRLTSATGAATAALCLAVILGCAAHDAPRARPDRGPTGTTAPDPSCPEATAGGAQRQRPTVLAISVDGLRPAAVRQLGRAGAPTLHRLIRQGAGTLNARTTLEETRTLPNHTTMVTGRPVARSSGGHGV